jgi:antirestriction protein ArdC
MPRGEYEHRPGAPEPEDRLATALQTLEQGIDSILTSDGFAAYLKTMARFHAYSSSNIALIQMQRPEATRVAGYRKWQELGRQVKKDEKGIAILVPHKRRIGQKETEDDEVLTVVSSFGVGTVFDVCQTDGEPLPEPPKVQTVNGASDAGMYLNVDLLDYLESQGITTAREETRPANGYYNPLSSHVGIGLHIDGDQATKTLTHETAHVVAGHTIGMNNRDVETIAESAAFVVLEHFGIDSAGYTFPYVATWAQDREVLKRNLAAVQQTAHRIIAGLEGSDGKRSG